MYHRHLVASMNWLTRHRFELYIRNALWLFPTIAAFGGLISVNILHWVELAFDLHSTMSTDLGRGIMSTVAGSLFSLMVLVSSAVLVAVQLASAQLTPRVVAVIYRDPFRKLALSTFAFTFTFSVGALARMEERVSLLTTYVAAYGFLFNLALFLYFIDGIGKALRPSYILRLLALKGRTVVKEVYPFELTKENSVRPPPLEINETSVRVVPNEVDGVLLAYDLNGLISLAEKSDCIIEMVPEVGDFVAAEDALFVVYGNSASLSDEALKTSVALGDERTLEQDPMFPFRVMVDIASRALSPAINDPTTAVLAIDQIQHLLREVGKRYLAEGRVSDANGKLRFVYNTPNWEDFVNLAATEIRLYGRDSVQVMRRLRSMFESLESTLPELRHAKLHEQIRLLDDSVENTFAAKEDQAMSLLGDFQGLGGSREAHSNRKTRRRLAAKAVSQSDGRKRS